MSVTSDTPDKPEKKKGGQNKGMKIPTTSKKIVEAEMKKSHLFQPGNKAAQNRKGWSLATETRQFRTKCAGILLTPEAHATLSGMYVQLAMEGKHKEWMMLNQFLAEYAFGKPREMPETDEGLMQLTKGTENTPPIFGFLPEEYNEAVQSDQDYQDKSNG